MQVWNVATGEEIRRVECLRIFLNEFEKSYRSFCSYGFEIVAPELIKRSSVIGRKIDFTISGKKESGTAMGYDENGGLRVKSGKGIKVLTGGEVTIRRK